jgi:hypothetical protein
MLKDEILLEELKFNFTKNIRSALFLSIIAREEL